ncbi:type IV secretion system protein VirB5 [Bartonella sp. AR 15-3]|uniref:type IV secretion system protein VirB5 n=1 Tax=Bartonella sp. AR 15-3 TaxID=545617 RepID=UPI0009CE1235|nr:type IV secretion system protein VirB5 [Bartonella sp. AR 15-3]OPB31771.1 hypothetical protein BAR153v2_007310 [Bartonella sp. AR 15-3]OPB31793.1 hypothetical protein BAR153v2_007530 [Bartonella sp. AR 15-3]OPB32458.1 hypothetical protein BAR153v2_014420 [Bartonella sp. AR 15-3]
MNPLYLIKLLSLCSTSLLSLCSISYAASSTDPEAYYQNVIQDSSGSEISDLETAKSAYASAIANQEKIKEINEKLSSQTLKAEEKEALQTQLAILQANLQADILRLQASVIIKSESAQSKEQEREKEQQKNHEAVQKTLQEQLDQAKTKLKL